MIGSRIVLSGIGLLSDELRRRNRRRRRYDLSDVSLRATRPVVLVGQNTDIRFYFTVKNPRGLPLRYEGQVKVDEIADTRPQQNGFDAQHFRTEIPRLHCKWTTVGTKKVTAAVTITGDGQSLSAVAEGQVEVVAELDEEDRPL